MSRGAMDPAVADGIEKLNQTVINCRKCPRLVHYREEVARTKRRAYREWTYWGRPVPGFGDACAEFAIIGLAPAAHGANRTGRMFTGDRSGDFLYAQMYQAGFANQPTSVNAQDGLELRNAYISAAVRCAPPANKPLPTELCNCVGFLQAELDLLRPRAILALGGIAFLTYLRLLRDRGDIDSPSAYKFRHGASYALPGALPHLFASYHPSQQNTQTGRLTAPMLLDVLEQIKRLLDA